MDETMEGLMALNKKVMEIARQIEELERRMDSPMFGAEIEDSES